ncbi:hypothetical protein ACVINW_001358 [Bradyrhizobium sp. USDA 4461]
MKRWARSALLKAVILFGVLTGSLQPLCAEQVSADQQKQLSDVTEALAAKDLRISEILKQIGFPPSQAPPTWAKWTQWPDVHILETAYRAAEAAKPQAGGDEMLKQVVRLIAVHNPSIRYEPSLALMFRDDPIDTPIRHQAQTMEFVVPAGQSEKAQPLPPRIRSIILTIAKYAESTSRAFLLSACFGLSENEAYSVLRTSQTDHAAFEAAIALKKPPPSAVKKISNCIEIIHRDNPAIAFEPDIEKFKAAELQVIEKEVTAQDEQTADDYRKALLPMVGGAALLPGTAPAPSPPRGTGSASAQALSDSYTAFRNSRYPGASGSASGTGGPGGGPGGSPGGGHGGGWTHGRMVSREIGFGGVIFGNDIASTLPSVIHVSWVSGFKAASLTSPSVVEEWGRFAFQFKDNSVLFSKVIRADSALAAKLLAFDHKQGVGAGYGLVGLLGQFPVETLDGTGALHISGFGFSYVVHPDLVATRLARALMMLDMYPLLLEQSSKLQHQIDDAGARYRQKLDAVFAKKLGWYKFSDVKLEVVKSTGGIITVQRAKSDYPSASAETLKKAFITLHAFDGSKPQSEAAVPIYELMPTLIERTDPFARANEFAEAFALLRWVSSRDGSWTGEIPRNPPLGSVSAMSFGKDGTVSYASSELAFVHPFINGLQDRALEIAKASGNEKLEQRTEEIRAQLLKFSTSRYELKIVGTVEDVIEANLAPEELRIQFPEPGKRLAEKKRTGLVSVGAEKPTLAPPMARRPNLSTEKIPGVSERVSLELRLLATSTKLVESISDFSGVFPPELAAKIDQVRLDVQSGRLSSSDGVKGLIEATRTAIPGFERWLTLELALVQSIVLL